MVEIEPAMVPEPGTTVEGQTDSGVASQPEYTLPTTVGEARVMAETAIATMCKGKSKEEAGALFNAMMTLLAPSAVGQTTPMEVTRGVVLPVGTTTVEAQDPSPVNATLTATATSFATVSMPAEDPKVPEPEETETQEYYDPKEVLERLTTPMVREMAGAVVAGMLKMGPQQINCDALLEECRGRRLPGVPEETVDQDYLRIETALGWLQ